MFGRQRRSWVWLFDPVGARAEWPELVWRFIELSPCKGVARRSIRCGRSPSVCPSMPACAPGKLGEYAYVPLQDFSLKGTARADLRQTINHARTRRPEFEVLTGDQVARSARRSCKGFRRRGSGLSAREKGFSLGRFSEAYLLERPVAVVRRREQIVAFATLMHSDSSPRPAST